MQSVRIRKEEPSDYRATELMTMRAFWNLHGPGCNEHYLVHLIRDSADYLPNLSRVAELDGKIVGAIFYTRAWITDGQQRHAIVTFGPLAVDPMAQSMGIGKMLLEETISLVKEAGYPGICIIGEPNYYPKHGFMTCDNFGITDSEGNNYDPFMGLEVTAEGFRNIKGRFTEPDVFAQSDDEKAVEAFTQEFPQYPKYRVPAQWLHEEKLGRVAAIRSGVYDIEFWEAVLPAVLKDSFQGEKPTVGSLVTFDYRREGNCLIRTVEKEL
ncbi:MAG: N-acetyltransferase [Roseburia sp.]|nr:N-acetyltransferase [Roseburia sp.]